MENIIIIRHNELKNNPFVKSLLNNLNLFWKKSSIDPNLNKDQLPPKPEIALNKLNDDKAMVTYPKSSFDMYLTIKIETIKKINLFKKDDINTSIPSLDLKSFKNEIINCKVL